MKVNTKAYGYVEVDERQKINFPSGIMGFENLKNYVLLDARQQPFYVLQSLDVVEIAFILIKPDIFRPDYDPGAAPSDLEEIQIDNDEDLLIFAIVTIPEDQQKMSANLQGPILINKANCLGRQIISLNNKWKVKHIILDELSKVRSEVC